jgi:hypothetical protein
MSYDIKNLFKQEVTKADMEAADDSRWAPAVVQVPTDDPGRVVPNMYYKRSWPTHVENVKRPRFGKEMD